jgi:hypothetical protein
MFTGDYALLLHALLDPNAGISLEQIPKLSQRIFSQIIRNKRKIRDMHDFTCITGACDFVEGMEYHYENFLVHLQKLGLQEYLGNDRMLDHEVAAYLHRLGQFYYFVQG